MKQLWEKVKSELQNNKGFYALFGIIFLIACGFRLIALSDGNLLGDEPFYSIRSIALLDTFGSDVQTTPVDWFDELPWWTHLSFHDHPPLVFWIHHAFYAIFGTSLFVQRLPSALFGIATVVLAFFLGRKLHSKQLGLAMMGILSINNFSIFYARFSMQESIAQFFILLGFFFFIDALKKPKSLLYWGIAVGLSILAKYSGLFLLPFYGLAILIWKREWLKNKFLYLAGLLMLTVLSPVIIYNVMMYFTVGHFDLQFAFLLGQDISQHWNELPGKEHRGQLKDRFSGMGRLLFVNSPVFFFFALIGLMHPLASKLARIHVDKKDILVSLAAITIIAFTLLVGASARFMYYTAPFFAYLVARIFFVFKNIKPLLYLAPIIVIYELFFSINSILATITTPIGNAHLLYPSALRVESAAIVELDEIHAKYVKGYKPQQASLSAKAAINDVIQKRYKDAYLPTKNLVILYDYLDNITTLNYVYFKRLFYEGWYVASIHEFPRIFTDKRFIPANLTTLYAHSLPPAKQGTTTIDFGMDRQVFFDLLLKYEVQREPVYTKEGYLAYWFFEITPKDIYNILTDLEQRDEQATQTQTGTTE